MSRFLRLGRYFLSLCAIGGLIGSTSFAARPQPVVTMAVRDSFVGADYAVHAFDGYIGKRMEINQNKSIMGELNVTRTLEAYKDRFNGGGADGNWGSEFLGKDIWAATYAWKWSGNATIKAKLDSLVNGIIQYQASDGYWGCASAENRFGGAGWDIWGCRYQLEGMLAYYIEAGGDSRILNACIKFGDLMCNTFGPGKPIPNIDNTSGWWGGLPSTDILEQMALLYEYTGYQRYLDFCNYLLTTGSMTWIQNLTNSPDKHVNGKCYESILAYIGLCEMYRITGNAALLQAAVNCVNDVTKEHLQINGAPTNSDGWGGVPNPTGEGPELCNGMAWVHLNMQLLRLTGQAKYAQNIEWTIYNQGLGAENPRSGTNGSFISVNRVKDWGNGTGDANVWSCCGFSTIRLVAGIPLFFEAGVLSGNAVIMNYFPSTYTLNLTKPEARTLTFDMSTNYPEDGSVTIAINASSAGTYPIVLRAPDWTPTFYAKTSDGQQYSIPPGGYLSINRAWKTKDTIQVTINMLARVFSDPNPNSTLKAIRRGPQFLSLDPEITGSTLPSGWWGNQLYACQVDQGGQQKTWYMVPYAEAGQTGSAANVLLPSFNLLSTTTSVVPSSFAGLKPSFFKHAPLHRLVSIDGRTLSDGDIQKSRWGRGVYINQIDNGRTRINTLKCTVAR